MLTLAYLIHTVCTDEVVTPQAQGKYSSVNRHFEEVQKSVKSFYRDETADEIMKLPSELLNMTTVLLPRFICEELLLCVCLGITESFIQSSTH